MLCYDKQKDEFFMMIWKCHRRVSNSLHIQMEFQIKFDSKCKLGLSMTKNYQKYVKLHKECTQFEKKVV